MNKNEMSVRSLADDDLWVVWNTINNERVSQPFSYNETATLALNMNNSYGVNNHFAVREWVTYRVLVDCDQNKAHDVNCAKSDFKALKLNIYPLFNTEFFFEDGLIVSADNKDVIGTYEEMKS